MTCSDVNVRVLTSAHKSTANVYHLFVLPKLQGMENQKETRTSLLFNSKSTFRVTNEEKKQNLFRISSLFNDLISWLFWIYTANVSVCISAMAVWERRAQKGKHENNKRVERAKIVSHIECLGFIKLSNYHVCTFASFCLFSVLLMLIIRFFKPFNQKNVFKVGAKKARKRAKSCCNSQRQKANEKSFEAYYSCW